MTFPDIDPVIFSVGPFQVRWYGLMYVLGFIASYNLVRYQIKRFSFKELDVHFENVNIVLILCVVLGGRLGYVLFYNLPYYLQHPSQIIATWQGGMSFHGALIGVVLGGFLYCYRTGLDFWRGADFYVVTIPIGLGLGRIGNFINGELYGRVSDVPWAMVFPGGGPMPRHPSQLYEFLLEGVVLFLVLWKLKEKVNGINQRRNWPSGSMLAFFLILYGVFRFIVEFAREPDVQLGFLAGGLTMGQILSSCMVLAGVFLYFVRRSRAQQN
jgi:phosphatidylglycerol:prolipoprotein diacylglycerol transferase